MPTSADDSLPLEDSEECDAYIAKFLRPRTHLFSTVKQEKQRRESHDNKYETAVRSKAIMPSQASKVYRKEMFYSTSKCDSRFINNLHTFNTFDGGSGYSEASPHYAMDFVKNKGFADDEMAGHLKSLEVSRKMTENVKWLNDNRNDLKTALRRSNSCPEFPIDRDREKITTLRRNEKRNENAKISNFDASFVPELCCSDDYPSILCSIATAFKTVVSRVNAQSIGSGELKIAKVLCSTEDLFAYVIPKRFNTRDALFAFSNQFRAWLEYKPNVQLYTHYRFINVILYLEEFKHERTEFRRARHVCNLKSRRNHGLFLELDTGMLRVVEITPEKVRFLANSWAHNPSAIVEVRFDGVKNEKDISEEIQAIRNTGRATMISFDREHREHMNGKWPNPRTWSSLGTVVLRRECTHHKDHSKPPLTRLFCEDRDCIGLCSTGDYFKVPIPEEPNPSHDKLVELRARFASERTLGYTDRTPIAAYILPNTDAHQNELIPDFFSRVQFLNGYSGPSGLAIITLNEAMFWVDNGLLKSAESQVDDRSWTVKEYQSVEEVINWLAKILPPKSKVGFDPTLVSYTWHQQALQSMTSDRFELVAIPGNIVDEIWRMRPFQRGDVVKMLDKNTPEIPVHVKIDRLRKSLKPNKCLAAVITSLEDIMWLLNIRGNDLPYNPVTYSYLFITMSDVRLFIDAKRLNDVSKAYFARQSIDVDDYKAASPYIYDWISATKSSFADKKILISPETNYLIGRLIGEDHSMIDPSIMERIKKIKNTDQLKGMRASNLRDSIAIVEFLCKFEKERRDGYTFTEYELAADIEEVKTRNREYIGLKQPTIFSAGEHSSVHAHRPDAQKIVFHYQQFMFQTGSHYTDGATNCARTIWDSYPTEEFMNQYTLVLKGHIRLASASFPKTLTYGSRLDIFARIALWDAGLDYDHETGHSVGHFLNIRDTQIVIGREPYSSNSIIEAGQVMTIEPGYYSEGMYGIRIGNCYETVDVTLSQNDQYFLRFEPLTLIPIQTSIVNKDLLTSEEINWLNKYHFKVFSKIGYILRKENRMEEYDWLFNACQPI